MNLTDALPELKKLKSEGRLILFVGSGISVKSGLPTWQQLVDKIFAYCESTYQSLYTNEINKDHPNRNSLEAIQEFKEMIEKARNELSEHTVQAITVLKEQLNKLQDAKIRNVSSELNNHIFSNFLGKVPNHYHHSIIKAGFKIILTTNYDDLLEQAAIDLNEPAYQFNHFSFDEPEAIASNLYKDNPVIIYIHGRLKKMTTINDIVLTKDDYQRIRKEKLAMGQLLRLFFIQYSVLFVGFGGEDPHISDVIEEVSYFFPTKQSSFDLPKYYIVKNTNKGFSEIKAEYNKINRLNTIKINDFSEYDTLFKELET